MRHRAHICLLVEVTGIAVTVITVLVIMQRLGWVGVSYVGPLVLVVAAVLPTVVTGRPIVNLGLRRTPIRSTLRCLCTGGVGLACLGVGGVAVLRCLGIKLPLRPSPPGQAWGLWVFFQLAYVAFPEELFFRGYLLNNMSRLFGEIWDTQTKPPEILSVILSALAFALSHVFALGHVGAVVTFFPGLIFGWVFVKTQSVIGPVMLHAGANLGYMWIGDAAG